MTAFRCGVMTEQIENQNNLREVIKVTFSMAWILVPGGLFAAFYQGLICSLRIVMQNHIKGFQGKI